MGRHAKRCVCEKCEMKRKKAIEGIEEGSGVDRVLMDVAM